MLHSLILALLAGAAGVACHTAPAVPTSTVRASDLSSALDSTGARLLLVREAGVVRITALYEAAGPAGDLRYELDVLREGQAGRSSTHQGGAFVPRMGRTDTLSSTSVNVSPGDRLQIHLRLFAADRLVDEAHHDEVISAAD